MIFSGGTTLRKGGGSWPPILPAIYAPGWTQVMEQTAIIYEKSLKVFVIFVFLCLFVFLCFQCPIFIFYFHLVQHFI